MLLGVAACCFAALLVVMDVGSILVLLLVMDIKAEHQNLLAAGKLSNAPMCVLGFLWSCTSNTLGVAFGPVWGFFGQSFHLMQSERWKCLIWV